MVYLVSKKSYPENLLRTCLIATLENVALYIKSRNILCLDVETRPRPEWKG